MEQAEQADADLERCFHPLAVADLARSAASSAQQTSLEQLLCFFALGEVGGALSSLAGSLSPLPQLKNLDDKQDFPGIRGSTRVDLVRQS